MCFQPSLAPWLSRLAWHDVFYCHRPPPCWDATTLLRNHIHPTPLRTADLRKSPSLNWVCWTVADFQARQSGSCARFCVWWVCAVCVQCLGQHAAAAWLLFAHLLEPLPLFANDYFAPSVCVSAQLSHSSSTGLHTCMCASPSPLPPKCPFAFAFHKNGQPRKQFLKQQEKR